jgi:hypothetical protein
VIRNPLPATHHAPPPPRTPPVDHAGRLRKAFVAYYRWIVVPGPAESSRSFLSAFMYEALSARLAPLKAIAAGGVNNERLADLLLSTIHLRVVGFLYRASDALKAESRRTAVRCSKHHYKRSALKWAKDQWCIYFRDPDGLIALAEAAHASMRAYAVKKQTGRPAAATLAEPFDRSSLPNNNLLESIETGSFNNIKAELAGTAEVPFGPVTADTIAALQRLHPTASDTKDARDAAIAALLSKTDYHLHRIEDDRNDPPDAAKLLKSFASGKRRKAGGPDGWNGNISYFAKNNQAQLMGQLLHATSSALLTSTHATFVGILLDSIIVPTRKDVSDVRPIAIPNFLARSVLACAASTIKKDNNVFCTDRFQYGNVSCFPPIVRALKTAADVQARGDEPTIVLLDAQNAHQAYHISAAAKAYLELMNAAGESAAYGVRIMAAALLANPVEMGRSVKDSLERIKVDHVGGAQGRVDAIFAYNLIAACANKRASSRSATMIAKFAGASPVETPGLIREVWSLCHKGLTTPPPPGPADRRDQHRLPALAEPPPIPEWVETVSSLLASPVCRGMMHAVPAFSSSLYADDQSGASSLLPTIIYAACASLEGRGVGIIMRPNKCKLIARQALHATIDRVMLPFKPQTSDGLPDHAAWKASTEAVLLGTRIGIPDKDNPAADIARWVTQTADERIVKPIKRLSDSLPGNGQLCPRNAHWALWILRRFIYPRATFLAQAYGILAPRWCWTGVDNAINGLIDRIFPAAIRKSNPTFRAEAGLPAMMGGLSLPKIRELAPTRAYRYWTRNQVDVIAGREARRLHDRITASIGRSPVDHDPYPGSDIDIDDNMSDASQAGEQPEGTDGDTATRIYYRELSQRISDTYSGDAALGPHLADISLLVARELDASIDGHDPPPPALPDCQASAYGQRYDDSRDSDTDPGDSQPATQQYTPQRPRPETFEYHTNRLKANRLTNAMCLLSSFCPQDNGRHSSASWVTAVALAFGGPRLTPNDLFRNGLKTPIHSFIAANKRSMVRRGAAAEAQLRSALATFLPCKPQVFAGEPLPDFPSASQDRADVGLVVPGSANPRTGRYTIDITVTDPLCPSQVRSQPENILVNKKAKKERHYNLHYFNFYALPMTLLGGISGATSADLLDLVRKTSKVGNVRLPDWEICQSKPRILREVAFASLHFFSDLLRGVETTRAQFLCNPNNSPWFARNRQRSSGPRGGAARAPIARRG